MSAIVTIVVVADIVVIIVAVVVIVVVYPVQMLSALSIVRDRQISKYFVLFLLVC